MGHYEDDYAADEESETLEQDEQLDEIMTFALNQVEGPSLLSPRPPTPYMSCTGCRYYSKSMASSGGVRNAPTYHRVCNHPQVWEDDSAIIGNVRSLNHGICGEPEHKNVAPKWCPFLKDKK